jgi:hypothetical protein
MAGVRLRPARGHSSRRRSRRPSPRTSPSPRRTSASSMRSASRSMRMMRPRRALQSPPGP